MNKSAAAPKGRQAAGMAAIRPGNGKAMEHRRPPPHHSMSLLHVKRRPSPNKSDSSRKSPLANTSDGTDSPSSLRPGKESSGESSNPETWFDKSNNEVQEHSTSFADDEPPFFIPKSSASTSPPEGTAARYDPFASQSGVAGSLSRRTDLLRMDADANSVPEFRAIVDDLTNDIKRLKRKLRRAEQYRVSTLKHEKLFEVRTPGLHGAQKRKLEQILKQFAERIDSDSSRSVSHDPSNSHGPSVSHVSGLADVGDSAYQSNSISGQMAGSGPRPHSGQSPATRKVSIRKFLRGIPESQAHSKEPALMSDREKKELIVDKLEEIFLGRMASSGRHLQPMQQQEVSDLAGQEDGDAAYGTSLPHRSEGPREAHMLALQNRGRAVDATPHHTIGDDNSDATGRAFPEQRPTKPLDLDPQREQNPMENVRYISHLGFSPIDLNSRTPQHEDRGWIYLNVLTNMAQLHSLSVTVDFMRQALAEYRSKFELSSCGRKVRWIGSSSTSRSGTGSTSTRGGLDTPNLYSPRKRRRRDGAQLAPGGLRPQKHEYEYTPLLAPRRTSDTIDSSSDSESDALFSEQPALPTTDSSAMTSSGRATGLHGAAQGPPQKKRKNHADGPMVFYKASRFITDLSGEHDPLEDYTPGPPCNLASGVPVGLPQRLPKPSSEKRGPLATTTELPEPMDLADNPIPASEELSFPTPSSTSESDHVEPIELEVTGMGGVWPTDNFAIAVRSCHVPIKNAAKQEQTALKNTPLRFSELLAERTNGAQTPLRQHHVISSRRKDLPPSALPPALSYMSAEERAWEEDETAGEDESDEIHSGPVASDGFGPSAALQPLHAPYGSSVEDDDDDFEDDDQDSNIDMLATARKLDPEGVRLIELAYDLDTAQRLAEEIPAGSSAATAGGGSGRNTPSHTTDSTQGNNSAAHPNIRQAARRLKKEGSSAATVSS